MSYSGSAKLYAKGGSFAVIRSECWVWTHYLLLPQNVEIATLRSAISYILLQ
jgi:hypothetical protein